MRRIARKGSLSRRAFLRGTGVALGLPWLDAMLPAFATRAQARAATTPPRRFVAMMYTLGFHGPLLFPAEAGPDYQPTPYLAELQEHRRDFTVISGLSHPEQNGNNGHASSLTWLTAGRYPGLPGFKNSISLDQLLIERLVPDTRFPGLVLNVGGIESLSWTASGVNLPAEWSASKLFQQLFVSGSAADVERQVRELRRGRSILDTVGGEARKLTRDLGSRDREKLDQYLSSVRDLESRLQASEGWATRPKPTVSMKPPVDVQDRNDILARTRMMHDLIVLALQTDSTRFITYDAGGFNPVPKIEGVDTGWHDLSHHGQDEAKIEELALIERAEFREINRLLGLLKGAREADGCLLDQTTVLMGSNLGNSSSHSWRDLPILVAGGGFRHGQHLVAGGAGLENARFANLFVQIGRWLGVELERFGTSDGTSVRGLESVG